MCWETILILCYSLLKTFCMQSGRRRTFDVNLFFSFQSLHCIPATILLALGSVRKKRKRNEVEGTQILEQSIDRAQLEKLGIVFYSVYKL